YQSALLSFQFRDYDGASRKFNEFIRKYSRSGLVQDARWNLAWISYLKSDYEEALRRLSLASVRVRSVVQRQRIRYWTAMSQFRLGRIEVARRLLAVLAGDAPGSYYGTVARQRLAHFPAVLAAHEDTSPHVKIFGPARGAEFLFAESGA